MFTACNLDFSNSKRVHEVKKLLMEHRRKTQRNPSSKTKEKWLQIIARQVSVAYKLSNVSFCPMLGQLQTKLGRGRREWQLGILLRLYLCKALFHMPTHLLLGSWQRSAAEGTYLPFVLLPPFHFSNPSCMEKPGKEKKRKTCQVCRPTLFSICSAPNNKPSTKMVRFHTGKSCYKSLFLPLWAVQRP